MIDTLLSAYDDAVTAYYEAEGAARLYERSTLWVNKNDPRIVAAAEAWSAMDAAEDALRFANGDY
jgi:hypothetical protein